MGQPAPIRVLHVFGALEKGGAESRTMDIYRRMEKDKVQFDFVVNTDKRGCFEDEIERLGGKIHYGMPRFSPVQWLRYYKKWKSFLSQQLYPILHIHTTNSAVPIAMAARACGVHTVVAHARQASETSALRRLFAVLQRRILCSVATHRFAVSKAAGNFIFGSHGRFHCIPNAICVSDYAYDPVCRQQVRSELGLGDAPTVVMVGRFSKLKKHLFLLDAFSALLKRLPYVCLLLVGDGECRTEIEKKIQDLHMEKQITLTGVREDLPCILQAADMFVMPSIFEGMPGAALEAQAAGLPCLLSDRITTECTILQDRVHYLPITDASIWAQHMEQILQSPPLDRHTTPQMQDAGFDIEQVAQWYQNFYMECRRK